MVLQQLVWENEELNKTTELYYHADSEVTVIDERLKLLEGTTICFDTYFNSFLSNSWERYTEVKQVNFFINITGKGTVILYGNKEEPFFKQTFVGKQELSFSVRIKDSPYFYLGIHAEKESFLERGYVETNQPEQTVKLALATCTYNRQWDIKKNIALLRRHIELNAGNQVLEQIYVIDNASNLEKTDIESNRIHLIPNRNTGGAGGFTKGIQEALKQEDITHIILMDDDVHIEFEALRRTKAFLSYIREKYKENFLGGAMFRTDVPYVLHAAGEDWADGRIHNVYKSTDMRRFEQVLETSEPVETEQAYAGWWYCCIPRSYVGQKGYPMPLFLHCDDVEYSLRSGKPPIYLNGIAVWHEEFEDKRSSVIEYYDTRNRLITNALYKKQGRKRNALYILCERFYATVFRYRYKDFSLTVKAIDDFFKGPEWLNNVDSEELHKLLQSYGYSWYKVVEQAKVEQHLPRKKWTTIVKYFLPATGKTVIRMGAPVNAYAGKKTVFLVEPKTGKGFMVRKSWKESAFAMVVLLKYIIKLTIMYQNAEQKWRKMQDES